MSFKNLFLFLFFACFFLGAELWAQDERFFRDIFTKELSKDNHKDDWKESRYLIKSPDYMIDVDDDKVKESFSFYKADGTDRLEIKTGDQSIFSYRFDVQGQRSGVFKMDIYQISGMSRLFLIYYYEGFTDYLNFKGTGRLYFLTIDYNSFKTFSMYKGPSFFVEQDLKPSRRFVLRNYKVQIEDYNQDSIQEVSVSYKKTKRVYFYKGNGQWLEANKN